MYSQLNYSSFAGNKDDYVFNENTLGMCNCSSMQDPQTLPMILDSSRFVNQCLILVYEWTHSEVKLLLYYHGSGAGLHLNQKVTEHAWLITSLWLRNVKRETLTKTHISICVTLYHRWNQSFLLKKSDTASMKKWYEKCPLTIQAFVISKFLWCLWLFAAKESSFSFQKNGNNIVYWGS